MSDGLPDPWWRPDEAAQKRLLAEVLAEVAPGHPLHGRVVDAPNRCGACDEVLVTVGDGSFAMVHLTWSGHPETPPYPRSSFTGGFVATEVAQTAHADAHG